MKQKQMDEGLSFAGYTGERLKGGNRGPETGGHGGMLEAE
jgi:hypothetical protein